MEAEVRSMLPTDVIGAQEVFKQAWLATYPNEEAGITREDIEDHFADYLAPERIQGRVDKLNDLPEGEYRLVASAGPEVVGVCFAEQAEGRNTIRTLYVLPAYQRKGIGSLLLREAIRRLGSEKDTYVDVATYNESARLFYERNGFAETGHRFTTDRFHFKSGAVMPNMEMKRAANR